MPAGDTEVNCSLSKLRTTEHLRSISHMYVVFAGALQDDFMGDELLPEVPDETAQGGAKAPPARQPRNDKW